MTAEERPHPPADPNELNRLVRITGDEIPEDVQQALKSPSQVFGKYVLLRFLGRGGSGYVRMAWDTMMGQYVALKFLKKMPPEKGQAEASQEGEMERVRGLLQEARLASRLRHENIAAVHDVGCIDDKFYVCMQFVDGQSLSNQVESAREGGWPSPLYADPPHYLDLFGSVVAAINYAHTFATPIVHCDLKPSNILIDKDGKAYIVDFGLARTVDLSKEEDIGVRGTPAYMAPEQLSGQATRLGPWTDIYGLGGLLYVLLTGLPPMSETFTDLKSLLNRKPPERPSRVIRDDPRYAERLRNHVLLPHLSRLEEICMRCLAKGPEDRYRLASRVTVELQPVLDALRGVRRRRGESGTTSSSPAANHPLVAGLDPALVAQARQDPDRRATLLDALHARLAENLTARRPHVPAFPCDDGSIGSVHVLKVTPKRIYLLDRGEVKAPAWPGIPVEQKLALADAAGVNQPDDRLALGLLAAESGGNGAAASPSLQIAGLPADAASPPAAHPLPDGADPLGAPPGKESLGGKPLDLSDDELNSLLS